MHARIFFAWLWRSNFQKSRYFLRTAFLTLFNRKKETPAVTFVFPLLVSLQHFSFSSLSFPVTCSSIYGVSKPRDAAFTNLQCLHVGYQFIKCYLLSVPCTSNEKCSDVHCLLFTDSLFKWNNNKAIPVVNFPILYSYKVKLQWRKKYPCRAGTCIKVVKIPLYHNCEQFQREKWNNKLIHLIGWKWLFMFAFYWVNVFLSFKQLYRLTSYSIGCAWL